MKLKSVKYDIQNQFGPNEKVCNSFEPRIWNEVYDEVRVQVHGHSGVRGIIRAQVREQINETLKKIYYET